jgi:predicted transcriptional regulator of viral defense system
VSLLRKRSPNWDRLFSTALGQEGLFTLEQAREAGYSKPLLSYHVKAGKFVRVRPGLYRLVHFPSGDSEHFVDLWLWSEREGIFSHETALSMFDLSDALPPRIHLTLPNTWIRSHRKVPEVLRLHYDDLRATDRTWVGPVQATTPRRTILDCARDHLEPDLLQQAIRQALQRGMVSLDELPGPLQP